MGLFNQGRWTEGRFASFIKGVLRGASVKWPPKNEVKKAANLRRGFYLCASCKEECPATIIEQGKRVQNIFVDHIDPVIDPDVGFVSWDEFIKRLFVDRDKLQVLCKNCHDTKTQMEKERAKVRKRGL